MLWVGIQVQVGEKKEKNQGVCQRKEWKVAVRSILGHFPRCFLLCYPFFITVVDSFIDKEINNSTNKNTGGVKNQIVNISVSLIER